MNVTHPPLHTVSTMSAEKLAELEATRDVALQAVVLAQNALDAHFASPAIESLINRSLGIAKDQPIKPEAFRCIVRSLRTSGESFFVPAPLEILLNNSITREEWKDLEQAVLHSPEWLERIATTIPLTIALQDADSAFAKSCEKCAKLEDSISRATRVPANSNPPTLRVIYVVPEATIEPGAKRQVS
jgi:hypothetical protein